VTEINYGNWVNRENVLFHTISIPRTANRGAFTVRLGVSCSPKEPAVIVETTAKVEWLTLEYDLSNQLGVSDFKGHPDAYWCRRTCANLKIAMAELEILKDRLEAEAKADTEADRAAFERSLQGL